jgi:hypothetical protein
MKEPDSSGSFHFYALTLLCSPLVIFRLAPLIQRNTLRSSAVGYPSPATTQNGEWGAVALSEVHADVSCFGRWDAMK